MALANASPPFAPVGGARGVILLLPEREARLATIEDAVALVHAAEDAPAGAALDRMLERPLPWSRAAALDALRGFDQAARVAGPGALAATLALAGDPDPALRRDARGRSRSSRRRTRSR